MTDGPGRSISKEKLALLSQAVEDGWPIKQIEKTYNTSWVTLRKHFPDYRGMNLKEASSLGVQARRTNKRIRKGLVLCPTHTQSDG